MAEIEDKRLICLMKGRYISIYKISDTESKNNNKSCNVLKRDKDV